ncbi:MAG: hypothetical protein DCF24_02705 [Cyanobium sp.]|nr:MAG: hypothetical protein DCF24_02705 [Cyanobium sp.]
MRCGERPARLLNLPFQSWLRQASSPESIDVLPLDAFHGDPADRLIVATGLMHGLKLAPRTGSARLTP